MAPRRWSGALQRACPKEACPATAAWPHHMDGWTHAGKSAVAARAHHMRADALIAPQPHPCQCGCPGPGACTRGHAHLPWQAPAEPQALRRSAQRGRLRAGLQRRAPRRWQELLVEVEEAPACACACIVMVSRHLAGTTSATRAAHKQHERCELNCFRRKRTRARPGLATLAHASCHAVISDLRYKQASNSACAARCLLGAPDLPPDPHAQAVVMIMQTVLV